MSVSAVIQNLGIADANGVLVVLIAVPSSGPEIPRGSLHLDLVAALSEATANFTADTSGLAPGQYTLRVQVNSDHAVLESTELNNSNTTSLTVVAAVPTNNIINGVSGVANLITVRRDPNGTEDDVWINTPLTSPPTQYALVDQPITINGGGLLDVVICDGTGGNPLPPRLQVNGAFTISGLTDLTGTMLDVVQSTVLLDFTGASPNTHPSTTGLKYTVLGDANLDGSANLSDFLLLARHFGQSLPPILSAADLLLPRKNAASSLATRRAR